MHRNKAFTWFLYVILFNISLVTLATAQQPTAAEAAIDASLATMVGGGNTLHDITMQGDVEYIAGSTDEQGTITLRAISDGSSNVDIILPSEEIKESVVFSGARFSGKKSKGKSGAQTIAVHNLMTESAWFSPAILLQRFGAYARRGEVDTTANTDSNGIALTHLTSSRHFTSGSPVINTEVQRLSKMEMFIASANSQPSKLIYQTHPDANERVNMSVKIEYLEYQSLGGTVVPIRIKKYVNNVLLMDIHIRSVAINSGLQAASLTLN